MSSSESVKSKKTIESADEPKIVDDPEPSDTKEDETESELKPVQVQSYVPLRKKTTLPKPGLRRKKKRRKKRKRSFISRVTDYKACIQFFKWKNLKPFIKKNKLKLSMSFASLFAIIIGLLMRLRKSPYNEREIYIIKFPGILFMRAMQGLLLPLVATSVITALGRLEMKRSLRLVASSLLYMLCSSAIAVCFSAVLTIVIFPGEHFQFSRISTTNNRRSSIYVSLTDVLRSLIPINIIDACLHSDFALTIYKGPSLKNIENNKTREELLNDKNNWNFELMQKDSPNLAGLVICCVAIGIGLRVLDKMAVEYILDIIECFNLAFLLLARWATWSSAVGIFFLIVGDVIRKDLFTIFSQEMFLYLLTFGLSLIVHVALSIPSIFYAMTRSEPWPYMKKLSQVLFTSFATASSVVTMPATLTCVEKDMGLETSTSLFFIPFGATLNSDGFAIHVIVTCLFVTQALGKELGFTDIFILCLNALIQSILAPALPSTGANMEAVSTGLLSINIPTDEYITILQKLVLIDVFLNRFKNTVSVYSDAMGAAMMHQMKLVREAHIKRKSTYAGGLTATLDNARTRPSRMDFTYKISKPVWSKHSQMPKNSVYWGRVQQSLRISQQKALQSRDRTSMLPRSTDHQSNEEFEEPLQVIEINEPSSSSSFPPQAIYRK